MIRGAMNKTSDRRQLPRVFPTAHLLQVQPLHAANETGALERNSQRTAVWSGVSKPGFRSLRHRWEESREYGRRRALTEMEDLTNVA